MFVCVLYKYIQRYVNQSSAEDFILEHLLVHLHRRQELGTFTVSQAICYRSVVHYWETVANRLICIIYRTLTQCTDEMIHAESIWGTTSQNENAYTLTFHAKSSSLKYKLHNSLLYTNQCWWQYIYSILV